MHHPLAKTVDHAMRHDLGVDYVLESIVTHRYTGADIDNAIKCIEAVDADSHGAALPLLRALAQAPIWDEP